MFEKIKTDKQIKELTKLASEIWRQHFIPVIGRSQVEYMLDKFQSFDSVKRQINNDGYEYYFICKDGMNTGYFAFRQENDHLFLSKFYIILSMRSRGLGRKTLGLIEETALNRGLNKIVLRVNKDNSEVIRKYENMGMKITDSLVKDIGNGFIMDDYLMEKTIKPF